MSIMLVNGIAVGFNLFVMSVVLFKVLRRPVRRPLVSWSGTHAFEYRYVTADGRVTEFDLHNDHPCSCRFERRPVIIGHWGPADRSKGRIGQWEESD